jgi:hypothetical protein
MGGGFLDLESPPTMKTKSNKRNQQTKWRSISSAQRKPKTHPTKKFDQRSPPGPALKCRPLLSGTTSLHPRENWEAGTMMKPRYAEHLSVTRHS